MAAKLYGVPGSHPTAVAERALQLKGLPYQRIDLVPVLHKVLQRARFDGTTVPGLVLDGGRKVQGSRAILRELETTRPDPPLFPVDGEARRRVEEAEEWGDQTLQPLARRLIWWALSNSSAAAQLSFIGPETKLFPPTPLALAKLASKPVSWGERKVNDVTEPNVKADLVNLPRHLDRADRWIEQGILGADAPNAADLQIGSSVRLLLALEDLRAQIDARPVGRLARKVFPDYPGDVPAGALPLSE
jgi:glutathione S-transferase